MSLFSTIAYDGVPQARGFSLKGIGILVAGLVLGTVVGLTIANNPTTVDAPRASDTAMALDDFIRLNTTSYEGLVPAGSVAAITPQRVGDAFLDMNITSYEGLAPAGSVAAITPQRVGETFLDMNIASYEGLAPVAGAAVTTPQSAVDASFLYWNTTAFDNLTPTESQAVVQSGATVDPDFWYWNTTSLEYPTGRYTEQPSGPR